MPSGALLLLAALAVVSQAYVVPVRMHSARAPYLRMCDGSEPVDTEPEVMVAEPPQEEMPRADTGELKAELLSLAAASNRGEVATAAELTAARDLVRRLELASPIDEPTTSPAVLGTWELVFSDTQLFRSSPFFMAGRATCEDGVQAEQYDWFCDMHRAALSISTIGKVRQVVSASAVVSEFEVSAGAVPFLSDFVPFLSYSGGLPGTITGAIVSTASIESNLGGAWRLLMDTVEIKGSNLPLIRQVRAHGRLHARGTRAHAARVRRRPPTCHRPAHASRTQVLDAGLKLQTRSLGGTLDQLLPGYSNPEPLFTTTYLDSTLRISRDQDGKLFVYVKRSDATEPTDYSGVAADLGVASLLQGIPSF
jgi:hypothetical protein